MAGTVQSVHRRELQRLANERLREARALRDAGLWSGSYYLTGYAVELGLKACAVTQFKKNTLPPLKSVKNLYTHDLDALVSSAGLKAQLAVDTAASPQLNINWTTCKDWSEAARYSQWSEADARELYAAVTSRPDGVLSWIRRRW